MSRKFDGKSECLSARLLQESSKLCKLKKSGKYGIQRCSLCNQIDETKNLQFHSILNSQYLNSGKYKIWYKIKIKDEIKKKPQLSVKTLIIVDNKQKIYVRLIVKWTKCLSIAQSSEYLYIRVHASYFFSFLASRCILLIARQAKWT